MHSGFSHLRNNMPMNCRRSMQNFVPDLDTELDIQRIIQLFEQALHDTKGPWLFGHYTVADAMYAPVVTRFQTYGISVPALTEKYCRKVITDASMKQWYEAALHESEVIDKAEIDV